MTDCRNPECRDKYTPGIVASGRGTARAPVAGASMRWGWVNCRACNAKDKDPPFQRVSRSATEIAERARLADAKAPYVAAPQAPRLAAIKSSTPTPPPAVSSAGDSARLDKLLAQVEKLTDQVSGLLEENRALRAKLESQSLPVPASSPPLTRRKKKADDNPIPS